MSREREPKGLVEQPRPVQEHETSREAVLQRHLDAFYNFSVRAQGADRAHALAMHYFLRSVLREKERSLMDVLTVLYQKLDLKDVSEEFKRLVSQSAVEIGGVFGHGGDRIVLPSVPAEFLEGDDDSANVPPEVTPPSGVASITAQQLGSKGDKVSLDSVGISYGPDEDVRALDAEAQQERRDAARRQKRQHFARIFVNARSIAERFISRAVPEGANAVQLAERVEDTSRTLGDCETELYESFGFSAACIRNAPTEEFFIEYFSASERAGEDANEFDHKVNEYITVRARVRELLNRETEMLRAVDQASPEQILGVKDGATQQEVEQGYLLRLQVLDPDREEDLASIRMLHQVRDRALQRFENTISGVPHMTHRSQKAPEEGFFSRTFRAPGKLLRTLFGVAAFGAATGVAVHQFAVNDSDEPKIVDVALEDDKTTDLSGFETASPPFESSQIAKKVEDQSKLIPSSLRWDKDSIWRVVIDMLRDRGLSTSNTQVTYYTHQAMVDNHLDEEGVKHLKVGDPLNFTHVAKLMDGAVGTVSDVERPATSSQHSDEEDFGASVEGASLLQGETALRGFGFGSSDDWALDAVPVIERTIGRLDDVKPYSMLPTAYEKTHCMVKGESIYKIVHNMLRARGLNWTTERINFLTQLVVDKNVDRFRDMVADGRMRKMDDVWIPAGAVLDFSDAVAVVDDMERAKKAGKKAKTVKELAKDRGYQYPIMMKFPK